MTYRVLVTGASDWSDPEVIEQAITQVIGDRDDVVIVVGDRPVGAEALAAAIAGKLGLRAEQRSITRAATCWRCRRGGRGGREEGGRSGESMSIQARDSAMVADGAVVCLVFLTGGRDRAALS